MAKDYSSSLNLPNTTFAMRAELPKREPQMLAYWEEMELYERMVAVNEGKPTFILHDGPQIGRAHV